MFVVLCDTCFMACFFFSLQAGHSPLHIVARSGHIEVARCLLLSGAEPDLPNKVKEWIDLLFHCHFATVIALNLMTSSTCVISNKFVILHPCLDTFIPMLQDGVTAEIVALAQGNQDVAELLSKLRPEKRDSCIKQLTPINKPLSRIKMKVGTRVIF